MSRWWTTTLAIATVALAAACASPPQEEIDAARKVLDEAKEAEAETYAADSFREAQDLLNSAVAEVRAQEERFAPMRSYAESETMLQRVSELAGEVRSEAMANREQARQEASSLIDEAQTAITAAEEALKSAPSAKGTRAEVEAFQTELVALTATLTEAREAYDDGDYRGASAKAETVKKEAGSIGDVAKAKTKRNL